MSWVDKARLQTARRKAAIEAAAEAKKAIEAREQAVREAKEKFWFTGYIERILPRGVELIAI